MKNILAVLALLLPPASASVPVKNPDVLSVGIVGDIDSLDPQWQYDGNSDFASDQIYETLVALKDGRGDAFDPRLATKVPSRANGLISADGLTYVFPIRGGVVFHDGTPFEPEDVRYSLLRAMMQDRDAGQSWLLLDPILGVQSTRGKDGKPDASLYARAAKAIRVEGNKVVVTLPKPYAPLLSVLCNIYIVSRTWAVAHGDWDGTEATWIRFNNPAKPATAYYQAENGTGPFRLERWDRGAQELILGRYDHYWRGPARLKRVILRTIPEFTTRKLLLQNGDVDAIFVDREFLPQLRVLEGVTVLDNLPLCEVHDAVLFTFKGNATGSRYMGSGRLDGEGVPPDFFADKDVRLGFAYAFPYQRFLADVYRGQGVQQARGPIPRGLFGYDASQPVYTQDLAQARAHFERAFGGEVWKKGFRLSCAYEQGQQTRAQACAIMKSVIEGINPRFRMDVYGLLWSTFMSLQNSASLPLVVARWGLDYADPHNSISTFLQSDGTYAKVQAYKNPEADALVTRAVQETDPVKRARLYRRLTQIAHDDVPGLYTVDTTNARVFRSWVHGLSFNPIQMYGSLYGVYKE